jgi:hypothetical protein
MDLWVEVDDMCPFLCRGHHEGGNLEVGSQQEGMVDGRAPTKWFDWLASLGGDYSYMCCSPTTLIGIVLLLGCITTELLPFDAVFR